MRPSRRVRRTAWLAVAVLCLGLIAPDPALAGSAPGRGGDEAHALAGDSWIVTLANDVDPGAEAARMARAAGGSVGATYTHALNGFQLKGPEAAAAALRRNPLVASVEADRPLTLSETVPLGIERVDAFGFADDDAYAAGFRGSGARIAVLDTGIDLDHPDLAASIDDASGLNCLNTAVPPDDGHHHGTHVAGTAAAPLNGEGVVGIAPEATLVPIKMFDDAGNSSVALSLCALDRVVALNTDGTATNDIDVVNMSWGEHRAWGDCAGDALHGAICRASEAGAILVAGAGNEAVDAGDFVPAAYPEVISVSGYTDFDGQPGGSSGCLFVPSLFYLRECDDTLAFFSNHGPSVDVTAPSVNIYSTWSRGGYGVENGTSMATPHVAGILALMVAADPTLTFAEALEAMLRTGECPNGAWADADGAAGCAGQGTWRDDPDGIAEVLPNARRAAEAVGGAPPPPPPPPEPTAPGVPNLASATGGASSVSLSWSVPPDGGSPITGYRIYRGTASGSETLLASVGVQQTYTDSDVVAGTTYWYQVAAVNAIGTGARSNELSARVPVPPSAPTLLGAPADSAVALSWTTPTSDGGSAITSYAIHRSVGGGAESLLASTPGTETTYVDSAVTNGTTYTYRVAAVNAAGQGDMSNAVSVTPASQHTITAPDPPGPLSAAKARSSFGVLLSWAAPAGDGGSPIASYFVYRRGPGEPSFTLIEVRDASTTSYVDDAVARRSSYAYFVTAFNSYHESGRSNEVTIRTK